MALSGDVVARVSAVLAQHVGLDLPAWVVDARAAAQIARLGVTPHDYAALIASGRGAPELEALVEAVRVGETRLFRHRSQIAVLEDAVVPVLQKRRQVRVWSAACATGEEAYTLAVVLEQALPGSEVSVVATDVSADAIDKARAGVYPASALAQVPDEYRDGFEELADGRVRARRDVAARVRFERANLLDAAPGRDFDVVWCRNVLIYFTTAARVKAMERVVGATRDGGFVFAGYSESLRDVPTLDPVRSGDAVYYVKRQRRSDTVPGLPMIGISATATSTSTSASASTSPSPSKSTTKTTTTSTLTLTGKPDAERVAEALKVGTETIIELDGADYLDDDIALVIRRFAAASGGVRVVAKRPGARRWLVRNQLEDLT
jgi:chemotaxis protein methyltransferase CheR|nr:CheR family methyltransferase [Kofleriaceae bacterium]